MATDHFWEDNLLPIVRGDIARLSDVWRYSSIPATHRENTPEHQGWVTIYSILIHQMMTTDPTDLVLLGPIATHAATHDLAESITGDIVRTFKYSDHNLKNAIKTAENKIIKNFPEPVQYAINVHESQLQTLGRIDALQYVEDIVKMADFLSLWMFIRREVRRGNKDMYPYFDKMITDMKAMQDFMVSRLDKAETDKERKQISKMVNFYETLASFDNPTSIP